MELGFPSQLDGKGIPGAGNSLCKGMAACLVQGLPSSPGAGPVSAGCTRKKYLFILWSEGKAGHPLHRPRSVVRAEGSPGGKVLLKAPPGSAA